MKNLVFTEVDFADGYSIVIRSTHKPTLEEVKKWVKADSDKFGEVTGIYDIDEEDARKFYDFENEKNWPVFS